MLDSFVSAVGLDGLGAFVSAALQAEFTRTLAIFSAAAWVHSKQVRREIKQQIGSLVDVLRADLEGNKFLLGNLSTRVDKIETALQARRFNSNLNTDN